MSKEEFLEHMIEVVKRMPDDPATKALREGLNRYRQGRMAAADDELRWKREALQQEIQFIDSDLEFKYGKQT